MTVDGDKAMPYSAAMSNHVRRAAEILGGLSAMARALSIKPPTVHQWADGERPVPPQHCLAIERATDGAVTRQDLRPADAHLIWPDITTTEPAHG